MDARQRNVVHDSKGRTLLDNAKAYCPDAHSAPLLESSEAVSLFLQGVEATATITY
jgi:hypothetical protein